MQSICVFKGDCHQEALWVKEILEDNDIITIMPNEHLSGVMPHWSLATGGFSVFVPEFQFDEASKILSELNFEVTNNHNVEELGAKENKAEFSVCPHCGNRSVETKITTRKWLVWLLFILFFLPIKAKKIEKYCHVCKKKIK